MNRREEFAKTVLQHQAHLRVFVRMLGVAPDAVDDLAQDVFVVAYQRWETLDNPENTAKWLRGIARNLVRNELKKQSRRRQCHRPSLVTTQTVNEQENSRKDAKAQRSQKSDGVPRVKTVNEGQSIVFTWRLCTFA